MADSKITDLTALTAADPANDMLPIVDVSDNLITATGTTKRISINNILACSPSATLASATITGDLTVDTSTLKVDSANNRVGIVNASPTRALDVVGSAIVSSEIRCSSFDTGTTSGDLYLFTSNRLSQTAAPTIECQNSAKPLIINHTGSQSMLFGIGGSLQMTLNSTGLGVGVSPLGKFDAYSTGADTNVFIRSDTTRLGQIVFRDNADSGNQGRVKYDHSTDTLSLYSNGNENLFLNSAGNVGVGVTPSAWFSTWKVLQLAGGTFGGPSDRSFSLQNAFVNTSGQFQYISASSTPASAYRQLAGAHDWYTAAAGTSPNQITDFASPKMTLDASGNLVLGSAAVATTATDGFLYVTGCAGTPTGTPTAKTGRVPIVVDTTNNKLYFYSGGSWVAAN